MKKSNTTIDPKVIAKIRKLAEVLGGMSNLRAATLALMCEEDFNDDLDANIEDFGDLKSFTEAQLELYHDDRSAAVDDIVNDYEEAMEFFK
jgi:hypothetical protein